MPARRATRPLLRRAALGAAFAVGLLGSGAPGATGAPSDPRTITWERLRRTQFDPAWILPDRRLPRGSDDGVDLAADLRRLATRKFAERGDGTFGKARTLGDVVALLGKLRDDPKRLERGLRRLRKERPDIHRAAGAALRELLRDARIRTSDWDPDDDEDDDGFLMAPPLDRNDLGGRWKRLSGTDDVHQGACLIWADLDTIKAVENDYTLYPKNVGAAYDWIYAVTDSYVAGKEPNGRPFSSLRLDFQTDLPFPYTSFRCDLRVLNRIDADGHHVSDIYSRSQDFHWMAGQDLYLPLERRDGTWVAMLVVRVFGFDIDDVPEGTDARQGALRSGLGNLKRRADARFRRKRGAPGRVRGYLPAFRVKGFRKRPPV